MGTLKRSNFKLDVKMKMLGQDRSQLPKFNLDIARARAEHHAQDAQVGHQAQRYQQLGQMPDGLFAQFYCKQRGQAQ